MLRAMIQKINYLLALSFLKISNKRKIIFYGLLLLLLILAFFRFKYAGYYETLFPNLIALIDISLLFLIIILLLSFLKLLIMSTYRKRNKLQIGSPDNTIIGIENLYRVAVIITLFFALMYYLGVDLVTFFTSFALVSVAFVWLFKEYLANIIDGLLIIFSDDFKIGDYIKVNEYKGRIKDIRFLNSKLITDEGDMVFIPNSLLFQREVINFSKVKFKRIIFDFEIDKSLFTKIRKVEKSIVKNLKKEFDGIIEEDKFMLKVERIHHQGAMLRAEISVRKYDFTLEAEIEKNISLSVMEFIDKEEDKEE